MMIEVLNTILKAIVLPLGNWPNVSKNRLCTYLLYPVSRFCTSCPDPKLDDTPLLFVKASLDANNNTVTSSAFQATPFAVLVSYLSQISTNAMASAKRLSSLARSGLVSLPWKYGPLIAHPPTYNASKPPSTDSRWT